MSNGKEILKAYESLKVNNPQAASSLNNLEVSLSLESQYHAAIRQSEEFWRLLRADIQKLEKAMGAVSDAVSHEVKMATRSLFREIHLYYYESEKKKIQFRRTKHLAQARVARNVVEHGLKKIPFRYVRTERESTFEWTLGIDLTVAPKRLANRVEELWDRNKVILKELLKKNVDYINISDIAEKTVEDMILHHISITEEVRPTVRDDSDNLHKARKELMNDFGEAMGDILAHHFDEAREYLVLSEENEAIAERIMDLLGK